MSGWLFGFLCGAGSLAGAQSLYMWLMSRPSVTRMPKHYRVICDCMRQR